MAVCALDAPSGELHTTEAVVSFESEPGPLRVQVTPSFDESFVTVAVIATVCPWSVCAEGGETVTEIAGTWREQPLAKIAAASTRETQGSPYLSHDASRHHVWLGRSLQAPLVMA